MIEIPEAKLEYLDNIYLDPSNPNEMSKEQIDALKESMAKFGAIVPIIIDQDNMIIDGHQRKIVAEQLDMKQYPCIKLNTTKLDSKLLKQILNKLKGSHSVEKDLEEYKFIMEETGNLDLLKKYVAMDKEYLNNIIREIENPLKDKSEEELDETPEVEEIKTDIKYGDIIQLGNHRIMCGDSTKKEDVDKLMNGKKADMVFTDPPYNVNYSSKNDLLNLYDKGNRIQTPLKNHFLTEQEYDKFNDLWFNNTLSVLNDYNSVYVCGNYESLISLYEVKAFVISNILVWVKNGMVLGRMDYKGQHENILYGWKTHHKWYGDYSQTTIWNFNKPTHNDLHPTMKPIELIEKAINNSSKLEDIVLDLFLGSGSTLIACEKTDRVCYGMELSEKYCEVICQRYEKLTGKQRVKV